MALASIIDHNALNEHIFRDLNKQMLEAAEPIVKEAVAKFETEFRAQLAHKVLSTIQSNYSVERMGQDIRIIVKGFSNA